MPLHPTWDDIALRLILTVIAGGIIGFNRGARGHAARPESAGPPLDLMRLLNERFAVLSFEIFEISEETER